MTDAGSKASNSRRISKMRWGISALAFIGLIALTLWSYRPGFEAPFVLDDYRNIVDSPAIRWTEFSMENVDKVLDSALLRSRPVANLSFAIDHLVAGGVDARRFRATNVMIHLATGAALMWLCWLYMRLTALQGTPSKPRGMYLFAALLPTAIFLLHPLNTQAITYVIQRMASMTTLFVILSLAAYLVARYRLTNWVWPWFMAALVFWLLGLGTKENAVALLPVVFVYELCFFRAQWRGRIERVCGISWTRRWTVGFWVLLLATSMALVSVIMLAHDGIGLFGKFPGRDFSGMERLLTQGRVQLFHLSQLVWPHPGRLNLDHDFAISRGLLDPAQTLPALLLCCGLIAAAVALAFRRPRYGFPLMAYALFHAVEAGPVNLEIAFEHRMYLPLTMMSLLAAVFIADCGRRRRTIVIPVALLAVLVFASWTHARNEVWGEPLGLKRDVAIKSPGKARAQHNYAEGLLREGHPEEALHFVQRAVELERNVARHYQLQGAVFLALDRPRDAVAAYQQALIRVPDGVLAAKGLGRALEASNEIGQAVEHYLDRGIFLARNGRPFEAMPLLEAAESLGMANVDVHLALGNTYAAAGMSDKALAQYRLALAIDPGMPSAWYNLGTTADSIGRSDDALQAYEEFLQRAPQNLQQQIVRARVRIEALRMADGP